ncbi:hypothetical protein [Brevibacillus marinus]|uniref:hypothetical protein n=1 Tax=Brevibacillus marinus TaxID=2496837 RepID=UPI000F839FC7|nr:hypothetical protein [Brevibacillus marinus]
MAMPVDKKPIYDVRVKEILQELAEGKSREELAQEFGYKTYKSLDMYMRRRNFTWDSRKGTYVPLYSRVGREQAEQSLIPSTKVARVLALFKKEGADARTVAKQLGFRDHRDLAIYMKARGYEWSSEKGTYVKMRGEVDQTEKLAREAHENMLADARSGAEPEPGGQTRTTRHGGNAGQLERFLPLLELLERNKDKLIEAFLPGAGVSKVPRYIVPGIATVKSVHMMNTLRDLVVEYSREKNISQREIFEVALIEFFRKYGYEREVETLLGQK